MRLLLLLVAFAVAAAGIAYFLLGDTRSGGGGDSAERMEEDAFVPPALRGVGEAGRPAAPTVRNGSQPRERPEPDVTVSSAFFDLRVLDAETGEALPLAEILLVSHQDPCPSPREFLPRSRVRVTEGRARIEVPRSGPADIDLVVIATGYVPAILCLPQPGAPIEVRLAKGLKIRGRVRDAAGEGLRGATLFARPGPDMEVLPGHFSVEGVVTDEEGRFDLEGLLPGKVVLAVSHDDFMPLVTPPVDVPQTVPINVVLEPALRLEFHITTDDGRVPEHPTFTWIRKEDPTHPRVMLLGALLEDGVLPVECLPVKVPAGAEALFLEVQADGYAPWRRMDWPPTGEGGTAKIDVELSSDLSTGALRAKLVDERGEVVHYARAGVRPPSIQQIAGDTLPGAYVMEQAEDLRITAMPAGTYRLKLESSTFAPVQVDATITPGQETVVTIPVAPPAKLHVRFYGPEGVLVRFRLMHEGMLVHGFPMGSVSRATDEATGEAVLVAGRDGLTLSGLTGGTHTVEVTSDEVRASPTVVHLVQGETVEVEVTVQPR